MSTKRDARIDAYIARSAPFAQPILRHLRELVHRACPEASETVKWSFPHFEYAGSLLCGISAFKAHCAVGFWHQGMEKVLGRYGANSADAMGSLGRITSLDDLPDDQTMLGFLREAVKLVDSGVPSRPKKVASGPKKELPVPTDLAAALKKNQRAAQTFATFSPSHRKEYIAWISEAKREETRAKRLATALEWLAAGKARNWKYQNC